MNADLNALQAIHPRPKRLPRVACIGDVSFSARKMKTHSVLTCIWLALLLCGCATNPKLHRNTRPERIIIKEDVAFTMPWNRTSDVRIPRGEYRFSWEDKGYWYYDNPSLQISAHIKGRILVTRVGGFAIAKEFDEIGLFLYCEWEDMVKRGVGGGVVAMMPKKDGKIISWEGDIPKEREALLTLVGEVSR
jgi:hypothetical protein